MTNQEKASKWLSYSFLSAEHKEEIEKNINNEDWLEESFGKELEFGTGGLRGVVGVGTGKMNVYNIRKITLGLCLAAKKHGNKIVIGYDSRLSSVEFARATAAVCLNQGMEVFLFSRPTATPAVSFAIRELGATVGVNITASHNPPEYNGYKVYWSDGAQVTAPNDQAIMKQILFVSDLAKAMEGNFDESLVHNVDENVEKKYFNYIASTIPGAWKEKSGLNIAYTPLHGVGAWWVNQFYKTSGMNSCLQLVESQEKPDGHFPTVAYANPEDPTALKELVTTMTSKSLKYGLATDPDADRLAVIEMVEGKPRFFTGNEVGALFTYAYLLALKEAQSIPKNSFVVRTIVTSSFIDKIAEDFDVSVKTCLTGFKHIASVLKWFQESHQMKFLFGTEESIGYLFGDGVRDKDGIQATVMAAQMINYLESQGTSLNDLLNKLYVKYGCHQEKLLNLNLKEYDLNTDSMNKKMENLRANYPVEIAGHGVKWIYDYQKSAKFKPGDVRNWEQIEMPQSNVILFELENKSRVAIRPSGTEPKVKIYTMAFDGAGEKVDPKALKDRVEQIESNLRDIYLNA